MRGRAGTIAGNPVLIGAATILVVVVAVFLSYNANKGLPFVPTYQLKAEVPNAAQLVPSNEVRIGGTRVGEVDAIGGRTLPDGRVVAVLDMKLQKSVQPLPKDSTVLIRPRSALGLKYVQITPGHSREGFQPGDTIPLRGATPEPVELDQFLSMFDESTRRAAQEDTIGFGDAFAGRGESINTAIGALRPLLRDIVPVMRNLAAPRTHLTRFVDELANAASIVAPAAQTQASLFGNLDRTMSALREVARPFIQQSITQGRPALDTAIRDLPLQRPFLANTQGLFHDLRPGVRALRGAAPALAAALKTGSSVLAGQPIIGFNVRLKNLLAELDRFSTDPQVKLGVNRITGTVKALRPTVRVLVPTQVTCNYITLWFRNVSSLLSEGDRNGTWQRFIIVPTPQGPNNEGGPSSAPANGPNTDNHLHTNPYPNVGAPGQPKECEAGNEPYIAGRTITGNVPGSQADRTEGY